MAFPRFLGGRPQRSHLLRACAAVLLAVGSAILGLASLARGDSSGANSIAAVGVGGGRDINLITGPETLPHVTQNDASTWAHGNTVVTAYTDTSGYGLSPRSFCGVSTSTDGGATFTRLPYKFNNQGDCYGNSSVFYSRRAGKWFVSFFAVTNACGARTQWASTDGINWTSSGCIPLGSVGGATTWVDNNPASPFYGRQYALETFNHTGPRASYSTDDGVTWSNPITVSSNIRRAVRIIGSLGSDGTIFAQLVEDGGGGWNGSRQNYISRSTDGGATWSPLIAQGGTYLGAGRSASGDPIAPPGMYSTPTAGYWRELSSGRPGVGPNNVVHYTYAARTTAPADPGNIYYVRSTDNGSTWSAPIRLNSDSTTRAQWTPSLSVNANGLVAVSWYDDRNTATDALERYARVSRDNGATWEADFPLSDVTYPKPLQPDPNYGTTSVGTYNDVCFSNDNYGDETFHTWVDGRITIGGNPQQDVFIDKISFPPQLHVVTTTADHDDGVCDSADCTLREAIIAGKASGEADVIQFTLGLSGTIELVGPLPAITHDLTIEGPGADRITVRRNSGGDYGIFTIMSVAGVAPTAAITGITVANGNAVSERYPGDRGGGIYIFGSALTLRNCAIDGNSARFGGGGIFSEGNSSLLVENSLFRNNAAIAGSGGGLNHAGASATVLNCSFSGNTAAQSAAGLASVGGSPFGSRTTALHNCTFSNNSAAGSGSGGGGAVFFSGSGNAMTFANNLFGHNTPQNFLVLGNPPVSQGRNISLDAAGGGAGTAPGGFLNGAGDKRNTDPRLQPLGKNGGPTQTHALFADSPAIDYANTLAQRTDQRGYLRNGTADCGAFEFNGLPPSPVPLLKAVSRKSHGSAGAFDVNFPLTGTPGVETRTGGVAGNHTIIVTFANPLVSVAADGLTSGTGMVSNSGIGDDPRQYIVELSGVTNAQRVTLTLGHVSDSVGNYSNMVNVPLSFLTGDSNGDGTVNSGDAIQTRNRSGQATNASNFLSDYNLDGIINSGDATIVRGRSGQFLP